MEVSQRSWGGWERRHYDCFAALSLSLSSPYIWWWMLMEHNFIVFMLSFSLLKVRFFLPHLHVLPGKEGTILIKLYSNGKRIKTLGKAVIIFTAHAYHLLFHFPFPQTLSFYLLAILSLDLKSSKIFIVISTNIYEGWKR